MGDENAYRYKYNGIEEVNDFGLDLSFATFRTLDPSIGRWLQIDPVAEKYAGMNPYNSMGNNPVSFSDPQGDDFGLSILIGMAVGAAINAGSQYVKNDMSFNNFNWGSFAGSTIVGGVTAGVGAGVGAGIGAGISSALGNTGFIAGAASGAGGGFAAGFVGGFGNGLLQGNSFGNSLELGLKSGGIGALSGGIIGGVSKGLHAIRNGRNFWNGNAKQYPLVEAMYASSEGGTASYTNGDDFTVTNGSTKNVYYKPEDGIYGTSNKIKPGMGIKVGVDGVATMKHSNMVYKVPGKLWYDPKVKVGRLGDVSLRGDFNDWALGWATDPGWKTRGQLDANWNRLFTLARIIR